MAGIYVDGNLGFGGHSAAILEHSAPDGMVIGFDLDPVALEYARERLAPFGRRIRFVRGNFAEMATVLHGMGITAVQGILLDLGLSSFQLDASGRGFSFQGDEPLDMRMDPSQTTTAADLVNTLSRDELADILYFYGEERQARRIASCIVEERQHDAFRSTGQLAGVIERAVPRRFHPPKIHMATRSFQALRIAVNNEMENLGRSAGHRCFPAGAWWPFLCYFLPFPGRSAGEKQFQGTAGTAGAYPQADFADGRRNTAESEVPQCKITSRGKEVSHGA